MKKYLLILLCAALPLLRGCGTTSVDETAGEPGRTEDPEKPDPDNPEPIEDPFETFVLLNFDTNGDGEISAREADEVTEINCTDMKIEALTGIDRFRNLTRLDCSYNNLTALDLSRNSALTYLVCSVNRLGELHVAGCRQLETLLCSRNALAALDLSNNAELRTLDCGENRIAELDVSGCPVLDALYCKDNGMTTVWLLRGQSIATFGRDEQTKIRYKDMPADVFQLYLLEAFDADGDMLLSENEVKRVTSIDCSGRIFSVLTGLGQFTNLRTLICSGCGLTELDLSGNPGLTRVDCSNNLLMALDVSENRSLTELDCRQNPLGELWLAWTQVIGVCRKDATTRIQFHDKPVFFSPGDWYDDGEGVRGIVFEGGYNYDRKKLLALEQLRPSGWCTEAYRKTSVGAYSTTDGAANMAAARKKPFFESLTLFSEAAEHGEGWYPLAKEEVQAVLDNLTKINEGMAAHGGEQISGSSSIMTSSEVSATAVWGYSPSSVPVWSNNISKSSSVSALVGHTF